MPLELTNSQVIILKTLLRNPRGLTREEIAEKSGVLVSNDTLGPVYVETETSHPDSLVTLRLVLREKRTPDDPVIYTLSSSGRKAADRYTIRKKMKDSDKVPADILNPVVIKIRPLKPYSDEHYTDDDMKEIRDKLPEEYQTVSLDSIRRQIANQRKQGAYRKDQYTEPQWYKEYRTEREYQVFAEKVKAFYDGCAICSKNEDIEVYHRRFKDDGKSIVYQERAKDGILLCGQCHKRNYRFMASIPESAPDTFADSETEGSN